MVIKTNNAAETVLLGKQFAKIIKGGEVILLEGDLGGGKTTFVRGVLAGLGCKARALSPSFTLVRQHKGRRLDVYHIDLYRLTKGDDIFNLGIEEYMYAPRTCMLFEWGEKIEDSLPRYLKLKFSFVNENQRRITISSKGYDKERLRLWGILNSKCTYKE